MRKGMKVGAFVICVVLGVFIFSAVIVRGQEQMDEIDKLMENKTVENCEKAIEGYKSLLKDDPENFKILYKLANAYTAILDIKTEAVRVEKDEYKPLLKELGTLAYDYAEKAYKLSPKDKDVVVACLVSYAYKSASFGIVKAILKGAAGHYKDLCNQLIGIDDSYMGGFGYRMLGKLYLVAPWPVGSKSKALEFFKKAVAKDNSVLYSHYYLGFLYYDDKKFDLARNEFQFVRDNEPAAHEKHYMDSYKKMARFYVRLIERMKKK
jgi:tetratricopeptide (TPR) repeat protein